MYDKDVLNRIEELMALYEFNWGQKIHITHTPPGVSQEKFVIVLERIVDTGESWLVGWNKCFLENRDDKNFSEYICVAMAYVESKLSKIDARSIDRERLRKKVNREVVTNVKKLVQLEPEKSKQEIERLFMSQLNEELIRFKEKRNR